MFSDEGLDLDGRVEGDPQFYAALLTEVDDLQRVDANANGEVGELIDGTDFDAEAVLVAQTEWGSARRRRI